MRASNDLTDESHKMKKHNVYIAICLYLRKKQSTQRIRTLHEQTHRNKLDNIPESIVLLMYILHCHRCLLGVTIFFFGQLRESTREKRGEIQCFILSKKGRDAKFRIFNK